jgi:hypothetical protein
VPFVNNELLRQLLQEVSALRKQLSDQQHATGQAQQSTAAAVQTSLNETRAVVRQALAETRQSMAGPLATISAELATIHADVQHLRETEAPPVTTDPAVKAQPDHGKLLRAAAGVSAARFNVHRDTWAFLVEHAGRDRHFHIPGDVRAANGTVQVDVSGPSLVAALTTLSDLHQRPGIDPGTAAIAKNLYDRIADTVAAVAQVPHTGEPDEPVTITVDDRPIKTVAPEDTEEPGDSAPGADT